MISTDEIRETFLQYFKRHGHTIVASDSLLPQNDPTLLFTGAGMNPFKEYFLGIKKDLKRATSSQKCLRAGDLDEVGHTAFHHSFFEMLGNFSFGDYFKKEAIHWAWDLLTKEFKIPKEKLRISVHTSDDEAAKIWHDEIGIRKDWITKLGDKTNFWPANAPEDGPNGPCGPCSEIYYDQGENPAKPHKCSIEHDCGRFAEIWNLVFTQFDRQDGGKLAPLANKNIDTGMGLERLACILQGKKRNFNIDIFLPINQCIEELLGVERTRKERTFARDSDVNLIFDESRIHTIADHIRAIVFSISDGVMPSNEGRGYVIRKLIRRALWNGHVIKRAELNEPFLYRIVPSVVSTMSHAYPELVSAKNSIELAIKGEEERFLAALESGLTILESRMADLKKKKLSVLPGELVFELYDTHGFPDELTRNIARAAGFEINHEVFEKLMNEQRERAKASTRIADSIFSATDLEKQLSGIPATQFLGYDSLEAEGRVLHSMIDKNKGIVVLDRSPCYGESGGQVGDQGRMENGSFKAKISDTQKKDAIILHHLEIEKGSLKKGDTVRIFVDPSRRVRAMRNHTATHLLHAALREVLGPQVRQLGSLVSPEKLRFDYSYSAPLKPDEFTRIEDLVNQEILKNTVLSKEEKPIEEAKKEGAIAFFGEKYGTKVRVVSVPGFSKEFCGGTHCDQTGQIGLFVIVSDASIASGTRRIEALTGEGAIEYVRNLHSQMNDLTAVLKTTPGEAAGRVQKLQETVKRLDKEVEQAKTRSQATPRAMLDQARPVGPYRWLRLHDKTLNMNDLRKVSDGLRSAGSKTIFFLSTEADDKIQFLLGTTPDLAKGDLDMRELAALVNPVINASAGGRKDLVQGGAPNEDQLQIKQIEIDKCVADYLLKKANV